MKEMQINGPKAAHVQGGVSILMQLAPVAEAGEDLLAQGVVRC